jgi:hypothetical protein
VDRRLDGGRARREVSRKVASSTAGSRRHAPIDEMMPPWWPGMILKGTPDDLLLVVVDTESASSNSASVAQSRTLSACALRDERFGQGER